MMPLGLWAERAHYDISGSVWTDRYDPYFRTYTDSLFEGEVHWQVFKLQAIAESGLRQKARHKSGATGLMQVMPATFREIKTWSAELHGKSLYSAQWNIAAGMTYNRYLYGRWGEGGFEGRDRLALMLASYNAGYSRTLKAVVKARKKDAKTPLNWEAIRPYVPSSTKHYVERILSSMPKNASGSMGGHQLVLREASFVSEVGQAVDDDAQRDSSTGIGSIVHWMEAFPVEEMLP